MTYAELLQQYFERSSALQWYWTIYLIIAGGLLAFSSLRQKPDKITGILVTVLFCMFAYKNMGAIGDSTHQRIAIRQSLDARAAEATSRAEAGVAGGDLTAQQHKVIGPTLITPEWEGIRNFHIASDVLIVLTIWAMELRRMRQAKAAAG